VKSPRFILLSIAAIALLAGCGKSSSPVNAVPPESPTLDTTPPPVPTGFCVTSDPSTGAESIVWNASSAPDLAKYEVYVYSPDPSRDESFVYLTTVSNDVTSYTLDPVSSATTLFYRLRAVDASGNRSAATSTVSVSLAPASISRDPDGGSQGTMTP